MLDIDTVPTSKVRPERPRSTVGLCC